ncbi:hypothetical protein ACP4OV_017415 [Aristida adscensionis]
MAQPQPVPSRAHGGWSDDETHALVDAWAPLYERRRRCGGPPSHGGDGRVKASGALAARDWQHVAGAVNARRAAGGLRAVRTPEQCKLRVRSLRSRYGKELDGGPTEWRFFPALHAVWAGEVAGRRRGGGAAAAADGGRSGEVVDDGDEGRGAPVAKRTTTTAGAAGREAPVQEKKARRAADPAGKTPGGATPPAGDGIAGAAALAEELLGGVMRGGAAADAAVAAGGTSCGADAAVVTALGGVVTKLADVYRHCSLKRMELAMQRERLAAAAATAAAAGTGQKPKTT